MKSIVLCGPHDKIKSYTVCLIDNEANTVSVLLVIKPSTLIDDNTYHELMKKIQMSCSQDYIPTILEEK
jgi:hypothetical protein